MNDGTAMDAGTRMDGGTPCGNTASEATIHAVIAHHDGRGKALREMIGVIIAFLTLAPPSRRHPGRVRIASGERKVPNRRGRTCSPLSWRGDRFRGLSRQRPSA